MVIYRRDRLLQCTPYGEVPLCYVGGETRMAGVNLWQGTKVTCRLGHTFPRTVVLWGKCFHPASSFACWLLSIDFAGTGAQVQTCLSECVCVCVSVCAHLVMNFTWR